jgi:Tfp pilus assembly protein PilN
MMSLLTDRDTGLDSGVVSYSLPRVNLLPPEIHEARRLRRTQLALGGCVVAVLAALGGVYAVAAGSATTAGEELAAEQARTTTLSAEQAKYAEVPRVLAQVDGAKAAQERAMATDVLWYSVLNDLALTYPSEVWLDTLTVTVADPSQTASTTNPLATPGIGMVTFTGKAETHSDVASWLDVLDRTSGFADGSYTSSTRTDADGQIVVEFTSDAVVTGDALSHRFDRKAS